ERRVGQKLFHGEALLAGRRCLPRRRSFREDRPPAGGGQAGSTPAGPNPARRMAGYLATHASSSRFAGPSEGREEVGYELSVHPLVTKRARGSGTHRAPPVPSIHRGIFQARATERPENIVR